MFTYEIFEFIPNFFVEITLYNFSLQFVFFFKLVEFLDSICNLYEFFYTMDIKNYINFNLNF
jgi:hypothetical protein